MSQPHSTAALPMMKALSLWQPYASAIAYGMKRVETRSWPTNHRDGLNTIGFPLLIHAAKKNDARGLPFKEILELERRAGCRVEELPGGCFVAVCRLVSCRKTSISDRDYADWVKALSPREKVWGNFDLGRFGWGLESVYRIASPIVAKGFQSLWSAHFPWAGKLKLVEAPPQ